MARIEAATVKGSVYYTDEFVSETYADGEAHINGLEGFWSFAKGLHRPCHGVDEENFPTYLDEYEFRYNHRGEQLLPVLFEALIRPQLIKDGLA